MPLCPARKKNEVFKMKKTFETPEIELHEFTVDDVITTSGGFEDMLPEDMEDEL